MNTLNGLVSVCVAVAVTAACAKVDGHESRPPQPVRAETVSVAPAPGGMRYSATIEAFEQVSLAFKASGYVDDVLRRNGGDGRSRVAQPGDRITRGSVLARLRDADYRERVSQGRSRLAEADASLSKARLDLERARTLFAADSLTKPELDSAQSAFDAARARVSAAQSDIELAQITLRDTALVAPATGVILERRIEIGTLANAGTVGFVVGDVSAVKARFGIPDSMVQSVAIGDAIHVSVEAVGGATFAGRVTAIAPTADPQSRVFNIEVTIPNQDAQLRPGMIGTVAIGQPGAAAAARALTVPLTAIVRTTAGPGEFAVLVIEHVNDTDVARMRRVELGEVIGNDIAVLKGLTAGDRVVVSGATLLTDGDLVRVLP